MMEEYRGQLDVWQIMLVFYNPHAWREPQLLQFLNLSGV